MEGLGPASFKVRLTGRSRKDDGEGLLETNELSTICREDWILFDGLSVFGAWPCRLQCCAAPGCVEFEM